MKRAWIEDLEAITTERYAYVLMRDFQGYIPFVGEAVQLFDDAGEQTVTGIITQIRGARVVEIKIDHTTWREFL